MADSMDKASVIWPVDYAKDEKKKVVVKDATAKWGDIQKTVEEKLGYLPDMNAAKSLFDDVVGKKKNAAAKRDCSGFVPAEAYFKVGVVKNNLVFRAKQPKTLGDVELDALLAKNYPAQLGKRGVRWTELGRVKQGYLVEDVVKVPNLRKVALELADKTWHQLENWGFLVDAGQYEKKRPTDAAGAKKWCQDVYDKYIPATADLQINLPGPIEKELKDNVGKAPCKEFDAGLAKAVANILHLLQTNWLQPPAGKPDFSPKNVFQNHMKQMFLDQYRKDNA
jgi:hypothetical protein